MLPPLPGWAPSAGRFSTTSPPGAGSEEAPGRGSPVCSTISTVGAVPCVPWLCHRPQIAQLTVTCVLAGETGRPPETDTGDQNPRSCSISLSLQTGGRACQKHPTRRRQDREGGGVRTRTHPARSHPQPGALSRRCGGGEGAGRPEMSAAWKINIDVNSKEQGFVLFTFIQSRTFST